MGWAKKKMITLRIGISILDYFKTNYPTGYQTKINDVLEQYVLGKKDEENKTTEQ